MRVIGYVRTSTDRQEISPDAQRAAIEAWCAARGADLRAVHADVASGCAGIEARPGLTAALADLERGGVLLVAKRDRVARDVLVSAMVERLVERKGARVLACDGAGEADGPEGQLMRRMLDAFAEFERAIIRQRTSAALAAKRARGERTGSVRYGYSLADDGTTLVPNDAEQAVLARITELSAAGRSLRAIAADLNEQGLRTRRGTAWKHDRVRQLINPEAARAKLSAWRQRRRQGAGVA